MPSADDKKPATQGDVHTAKIDLRQEMQALKQELRQEIHALGEDLQKVNKRLSSEIIKIREEMATKADLQELKRDMTRMFKIVIEAVEKGRMYSDKAVSHGHILTEHEWKLADHEKRVKMLESKA